MQRKIRHRKTSYTVMIASDSARHGVKRYHFHVGAVRIAVFAAFVLLVVNVCYVVYSSITLSDAGVRNKKQAEQILQLKEESEKLAKENTSLSDKNSILSTAINEKVEAEKTKEAEEEALRNPNGFPLSGSAQVKTKEEGAAPETQTELLFEAAAGVNIIASGSGTVIGVDTDAEYGYVVRIDHGNGYVSVYRNAGSPLVKVDGKVLKGAVLFVVGENNTVLSYQIEKDGTAIAPMDMLEING